MMSYLSFCKQILLSPVEFLDQYFIDGKTPKELKQKSWFLYFKLWFVLYVLVFGILATLGLFVSKFSLLIMTIPILAGAIHYVIYTIASWFFTKYIIWAGSDSSEEKSKNLYLYIQAALVVRAIFGVLIWGILRLILKDTALIILVTLYTLFAPIYLFYLRYKIVNKATDISLFSYLVYLVLIPSLLTILGSIVSYLIISGLLIHFTDYRLSLEAVYSFIKVLFLWENNPYVLHKFLLPKHIKLPTN